MIIRLENWSVSFHPYDDFIAPELRRKCLRGETYGDPRGRPDGKAVFTNYIANVEKNFVTTESGTIYELGEPDPEYVKWCKDQNVHIPTKEVPIKWKQNQNQ